MTPQLKIGILGTRGIPNAYGGFEQFAQYLALGLVNRGHQVWVYNSHAHPYQQQTWNNVNIIYCKDPEKQLGTAGQFIYDYNCFKDARRREYDILLQLGYTSSSVWHRIWPSKARNIVNMDGLEWKRSKYSRPVQRFLKYAESLAVRHADLLIADSIGIQDYLRTTYNQFSVFIPYGAIPYQPSHSNNLIHYRLEPNRYFLVIARMEPENNIETIIQGYLLSDQQYPLLVVGSTQNKFGKYLLKKYGSENVRFVGAIYDHDRINDLRYFSCLYFHGHSVGGTNPSLLEAMACQCSIAAHDNIFNKAILGKEAWYFSDPAGIQGIINSYSVSNNIDWKALNLQKIITLYNWDIIVSRHEEIFIKSAINS